MRGVRFDLSRHRERTPEDGRNEEEETQSCFSRCVICGARCEEEWTKDEEVRWGRGCDAAV